MKKPLTYLLSVAMWGFFGFGWAQGLDPVQGEAEKVLYSPDGIEAAKKEVRQEAMIAALEQRYGALVYRSNATTITNVAKGERARTFTRFNVIANTYVKGDWVQTQNEKTTVDTLYIDKNGNLRDKPGRKFRTEYVVKCSISGLARELKQPEVQYEATPMNCNLRDDCATYDFRQGEQLYLKFKSPTSGYLSVWLDNQKTTSCLMPYVRMPKGMESGMRVEADSTYMLFSTHRNHNYFVDPNFAEDELLLYTDQPVVTERIFLVFATQPYNKPLLSESRQVTNRMDSELRGYTFPRQIDSESFQEWLVLGQSLQGFQVQVIDLTIMQK